MLGLDALQRAQFAFTVGAHIVLRAFSIGFASPVLVLSGLARSVFTVLFNQWKAIVAVAFGARSGIRGGEPPASAARFRRRPGRLHAHADMVGIISHAGGPLHGHAGREHRTQPKGRQQHRAEARGTPLCLRPDLRLMMVGMGMKSPVNRHDG
jgi:hypothetical protein